MHAKRSHVLITESNKSEQCRLTREIQKRFKMIEKAGIR